jgi:tRNA dimethylallyltransferase
VAKPTASQLSQTHHWFINSHHITESVNAALFEEYALNAVGKIFRKNAIAVMVGGTGLYIKAFCDGMDDIPEVDPAIRETIIKQYQENGLKYLQEQVAEKDPEFWKVGETENPQRLMRALEVYLTNGISITAYRKGEKKKRPFNIIKIGLELPRAQLVTQINSRTDLMIEAGLMAEATALYNVRHLNALQTVGYKEMFEFLENRYTMEEAVENIKINTRQYAKRQMTWFKRDADIKWYSPNLGLVDQVLSYINHELQNKKSSGI